MRSLNTYHSFCNVIYLINSIGLNQICTLRHFLLDCYDELTEQEIVWVIEVMADALEHSKLKDKKWDDHYGDYLAGNCVGEDKWREIFKNNSFGLSDIVEFTKYLMTEPTRTKVEYCLRNTEVFLRDGVIYNYPDRLIPIYIKRLEDIFQCGNTRSL